MAAPCRVDGLDTTIDRFRGELATRMDLLAARIDSVDAKVDRFRDELSAKMSQQFVWLVGQGTGTRAFNSSVQLTTSVISGSAAPSVSV